MNPGNHPAMVGAGQATLLTLSDGHHALWAESLIPQDSGTSLFLPESPVSLALEWNLLIFILSLSLSGVCVCVMSMYVFLHVCMCT